MMNARPEAWLSQARNDLALAQLAKDNGFLAQSCYWGSNHRTPTCSTISCNVWGRTDSAQVRSKRCLYGG